jgi:hypothetical protein
MAFDALNSTEIQAGKPNKQELWTKNKGNFDDHESRIVGLEATVASFMPIEFSVYGPYSMNAAPQTSVLIYRTSFNFTALAGRLMIQHAGSAGSTEVDIQYKRGAGAWTSIFSTLPSVVYTAGDYAISTNAVLSFTDFLAGDLIRLDITAIQTGGSGFEFFLEYER